MRLGLALAPLLVLTLASCGAKEARPTAPVRTSPEDAGAPALSSALPPASEARGRRAAVVDEGIARTLLHVSKIRGRTAKKPVPGVLLSRTDLVARVRDKALREYPAEALAREGKALQLLEAAPLGFDYLGETMRLLEAQLEGYYEPSNGTMYMASELRGAEAEATLAHELVHALQDQHWDLRSRSDYKPGQSDKTMALAVLAEGDATSAMMDVILEAQGQTAIDLPDGMVRGMMEAGSSMGDVASVPHVLRTSLVAPYVEGLSFVGALRRRGGWDAVDRAWARLPTSTEQVLHVEKWEAGEAPLVIAAPSARALGAGFVREDEDTSGELGYALTFGEWMPAADARAIAEGWGGDRSAFWAKGDVVALGEHLRYDRAAGAVPGARAIAAFARIARALEAKYGRPASKAARFVCFERRETGPLAVALKGEDLALTAGPARAGAAWSSAATCLTARAWADEILAN